MTQYFPSKIRHIFDPEKGLVQEIGDPSTVTFASGTIIEVSGVFAYVPEDPSQWAAVPTNLIQAVDYLAAGSGSGGGGGGGGTPGGSNGDIQYKVNATTFGGVNNLTFVGGNLVGTGSFNGVFSGSLTKLTDGTSYIKAGSNITVTTASNGSITIASTGGGGTISGSIAANQIAYGTAANTISGSGAFTFDGTTLAVIDNGTTNTLGMSIPGGLATIKADDGTATLVELHVSASSLTMESLAGPGNFLEIDSGLQQIKVSEKASNVDSVTIFGGQVNVDSGAGIGGVGLTMDTLSGTPTINSIGGGGSPTTLNLSIAELQINTDPGTLGYVLVSSGSGAAPVWAEAPYSAAVAGDWSGTAPTTIKEALDRIAAALGPIA